jgi:hypothetical protein
VVVMGIAWIRFDSLSTTIIMLSNPCDSGSSVIMSTEMTCHRRSGIGFGWSTPEGLEGKVLVWLQMSQVETYEAMYQDIPGHQ